MHCEIGVDIDRTTMTRIQIVRPVYVGAADIPPPPPPPHVDAGKPSPLRYLLEYSRGQTRARGYFAGLNMFVNMEIAP